MTRAFDTFLLQYHATGSEKADGYSRDAFIGLDEGEKVEVFDLLVKELPWAADWLFFLDGEKAMAVAQALEQGMRGGGYSGVHWLQREMVKYSGDLRYQQHMVDDYPAYADSVRPQVIDSIAGTPMNATTLHFFRQVILTETCDDAQFRACWRYLHAIKVPRVTEADEANHERWLDILRNGDSEARQRALSELAPFESIALPP